MTLKTLIMGSGPGTGVISQLIDTIVKLMFAAAVFFFLWNVFKLITKADQPSEMAEFKSKVWWGIVAIVVMASVWGLVGVVTSSTGLDNTATLNINTGP